jgi:hypothetical protein
VGHAATSVRALLFLVGFAGCGEGDPEQVAVAQGNIEMWVGDVANSDVVMAAASSKQLATVFFCGGPSSLVEGTHWFSNIAPISGAFSAVASAWRVEGSESTGRLEGSISDGAGDSRVFAARSVAAGTLAGVYDASAPCGHVGLIVRQDTSADTPSAQGACLRLVNGVARVEQVNPVLPLARDSSFGIRVSVASDPDSTLIVHPLVPGD